MVGATTVLLRLTLGLLLGLLGLLGLLLRLFQDCWDWDCGGTGAGIAGEWLLGLRQELLGLELLLGHCWCPWRVGKQGAAA
jgi:hypothetical protein